MSRRIPIYTREKMPRTTRVMTDAYWSVCCDMGNMSISIIHFEATLRVNH